MGASACRRSSCKRSALWGQGQSPDFGRPGSGSRVFAPAVADSWSPSNQLLELGVVAQRGEVRARPERYDVMEARGDRPSQRIHGEFDLATPLCLILGRGQRPESRRPSRRAWRGRRRGRTGCCPRDRAAARSRPVQGATIAPPDPPGRVNAGRRPGTNTRGRGRPCTRGRAGSSSAIGFQTSIASAKDREASSSRPDRRSINPA